MKVWTKAGYVAGLLVVPVVLAGCGFGGGGTGGHAGGHDGGRAGTSARARRAFAHEPAGQILRAMSHDMRHVTSFGVAGHLTSGGTHVGIDMHITAAGGGDCTGTVRMGLGTARIVSKGSKFWMKPDHAFWERLAPQHAAALEQMIGDRWVEASQSSRELQAFCNMRGLLKSFSASGHAANKGVVKGTEKVDGHQAVKIAMKEQGGAAMVWVAADRPHHMLEIRSGAGADTTGSLRFTEFNKPVEVTTPDPSDVADFS